MANTPEEWIKQADYDMDTAQAMFDACRYCYAVFMCHLALEKALKALYLQKTGEAPPKTHNLVFLAEKAELSLSEADADFVFEINRVSLLTRYPEEIDKLQQEFPKSKTQTILLRGRQVLQWLKEKQKKQ